MSTPLKMVPISKDFPFAMLNKDANKDEPATVTCARCGSTHVGPLIPGSKKRMTPPELTCIEASEGWVVLCVDAEACNARYSNLA